jgi:hypothetical protein
MPHSMPFSQQENKWFSILIMAALPFIVLYKWVKDDLPYLKNPSNKDKE